MKERIPYTYFIYHNPTNQFYYGSKYGKDADPELFWNKNSKKGYFTSSQKVKELINSYGPDSFTVSIRMIHSTPYKALRCERRCIKILINLPGCINSRIPGEKADFANNVRKVIINGESSYSKAGEKISNHFNSIEPISGLTYGKIRGKHMLGIPKSEEHRNNIKLAMAKPEYKEDHSLRMSGENNIIHLDGVKEKVKASLAEYFSSDKWEEAKPAVIEKIKTTCIEKGVYDKHSKFMTENNPASDTLWYNDGIKNYRLKENDLQITENSLKLGRLSFKINRKEYECPHCGKIGKGPNMKRYHFDNCKRKANE